MAALPAQHAGGPAAGRIADQVTAAALVNGSRQGRVALHHASVFRRTVIGVLQLSVGLLQQILQLLIVFLSGRAHAAGGDVVVVAHGVAGELT
jgi:hypothetical protein